MNTPEDSQLSPTAKVSLPVQNDQDQPWYAQGLRFACTQCGNCCSGGPGYVWLRDEDFTRIAAFLKLSVDEFTRTYVRRIGNEFSLTEKPDYDCIFLVRNNGKIGCSIYDVRPNQCRTWPFWKQNLKSPDAWKRASAHCPGMRAKEGPLYSLPQIEEGRNHPDSP